MILNDLEMLKSSSFVNGKRHFTEKLPYARSSNFTVLGASIHAPVFSILVTTFYRSDRLTLCLNALHRAIQRSGIPCELFVVETSIAPVNFTICERQSLISKYSIKYLHNPFITQSEARNIAIKSTACSSYYFLLLDCDIYVSESSIYEFWTFLEREKSVTAISPTVNASANIGPLFTLTGKTLLPDKHILLPRINDIPDLQPARMLRGIYALRISHCKSLLKYGAPFCHHFVLWQNVPFFQTLRELGCLLGYLPARLAYAIHDERPDSAKISNSMPDWSPQTLKSICLLIHRNFLWQDKFALRSKRFVRRLNQVVSNHSAKDSSEIMALLSKCAEYIHLGNWLDFEKYISTQLDLESEPGLRRFLLVLLAEKQSWPVYKTILSFNLEISF